MSCDRVSFSLPFSHQGELRGLLWHLQQDERHFVDDGGAVCQQHALRSRQR